MTAFLIIAGVGSVCACVGLVIGSILGANRYAKDMAELAERNKRLIAEQDQMQAEDVNRLRQEYEAEIVKLKDAHRRDVVRQANALHKRECTRIRKQSKQRGATLGANA